VPSLGTEPIADERFFAQMAPIPVPVPVDQAEALRSLLFERFNIEVPVTQHRGQVFVRVAAQVYTTDAELQALEAALETLVPQLQAT